MTAQAAGTIRFVRRTKLRAGEYRKNFHQIDAEVVAAITSREADKVTPLMSKIYLRLIGAPVRQWERNGVLRFEAEAREGKQVKAWDVLCDTLGVAGATASKALAWLHDQGVIGYFAGKNGVGIRIFLNRAASSIGDRPRRAGQKILHFSPASSDDTRASRNEAAFNDPFGDLEVLDSDLIPRAPKSGADEETGSQNSSHRSTPKPGTPRWPQARTGGETPRVGNPPEEFPLEELVARLRGALEPSLEAAAVRAARREHERTREWLDKQGIPKATRVAQREAYDVLRKSGVIAEAGGRRRVGMEAGRDAETRPPAELRPLSDSEIAEIAETCVAFLEAQGKPIEATLGEISTEAGGWLLPEDAPRVREAARRLTAERGRRE